MILIFDHFLSTSDHFRGEAEGPAGGGEQRFHVLGHAHCAEGLPAQRAQHLRRGRHALRPANPGKDKIQTFRTFMAG